MISLERTIGLLTKCWMDVEERVCSEVSTMYHAHDEVFITRLFVGQLGSRLKHESLAKRFEEAFLHDLVSAFPAGRLTQQAKALSRGLIARVTYHEPQRERYTGSDFGFSLLRPDINFEFSSSSLSPSFVEQGVLAQAKRQNSEGKWGELTENQRRVIPMHQTYFSLVLYGYREGATLLPFQWKDCSAASIELLDSWLREPVIPDTIHSDEMLKRLSSGQMGTYDEEIVANVIHSGEYAELSIEIVWPDGPPRPPDGPDDGPHLRHYLIEGPGLTQNTHVQKPQPQPRRRYNYN